ncbi:Glycosyltransferase involved in cell wall bisynthesis [Chryseobacterium arachidis]|uniref:Glycosyltransferase involved in cell wall bisynthesis n=2 Tax=Chryseobacterium arachidis TaxID=1416778 RepID=A0A1M4XEP0_9FLAO|nr:glycosyltransferase [Chryseobacterium arachidis]SHE91955.1 Glycosyltransferase involved in cell wall bisynthesis [Chryseobacterium arachidis]
MMKPLVSVVMITYGHEKYIEESINGVLSQVLDAEIELLISDDCSPDNTEIIVKKIIDTHPNGSWIKYIRHTENKGAIPNFAWTISQSTGKYVALCEGDDYWTDPLKLKKQVDFLERNEDYILCFHKVKILKTDGVIVEDFITKIPENYELRKTLAENSNYIHTPSVLFRNIKLNELNSLEFQNTPIGDYFLYLILTKYGKIGYLEDEMCVYRYGVGIFSSLDEFKQLKINSLLYANLYSLEKDPNIKAIFYKNLYNIISQIEHQYIVNAKLLATRRHKMIEKIYKKLKK